MKAFSRQGLVLVIAALLAALGALTLLASLFDAKPPPTPPVPLTIATTASYMGCGLVFIADAKGYFRDEGLAVVLQPHASGKAALASAMAGKAQLATVAATPVVFSVLAGERPVLIAAIATEMADHVILARRDRGITKGEDLKGKTVGTTVGSSAHYSLEAFLAMHGILSDEIRVVNMDPPKLPGALSRGEIDAISTWQPHVSAAASALGSNALQFHGAELNRYSFYLAASDAFARANPTVLERTLRSLDRAEQYAEQHRSEAQAIVSDAAGLDPAAVAQSWPDFMLGLRLEQGALAELEDQARWARRNGAARTPHMPNFLNAIELQPMLAVKPRAMTVVY